MDNRHRLKISWELFLTFFKIGAFTFGGGYAMIPLIQRETSEKRGWIDSADILDVIAIAESTPGPIAINSATFVGYKICGVLGSFCATLGVVLPSFIVIALLSGIISRFQDITAVRYAFTGVRAGVLALIIKALVSMYKQCPKSVLSYVLAGCAFVCAALLGVDVLIVIIGCALVGLAASLLMAGRAKQ